MKIKIRSDDTSMLQENDWLQTDGWLLNSGTMAGRPVGIATLGRRAAAIPGQKFLPRPTPAPEPLPRWPCPS